MMKKNTLLGLLTSVFILSACNSKMTSESSAENSMDEGEILEKSIDSLNRVSEDESIRAEDNFRKAKEAYNMAIANGDKNAQLAAEKALSAAVEALEKTKQSIISANSKLKEFADTANLLIDTGNAVTQSINKASTELKNAAENTESSVKGLVNDLSKKAKEASK